MTDKSIYPPTRQDRVDIYDRSCINGASFKTYGVPAVKKPYERSTYIKNSFRHNEYQQQLKKSVVLHDSSHSIPESKKLSLRPLRMQTKKTILKKPKSANSLRVTTLNLKNNQIFQSEALQVERVKNSHLKNIISKFLGLSHESSYASDTSCPVIDTRNVAQSDDNKLLVLDETLSTRSSSDVSNHLYSNSKVRIGTFKNDSHLTYRNKLLFKIFIILGIFPLTYVGWLIGLIYFLFAPQARNPDLKKERFLLIVLTSLGSAAIITGAFFLDRILSQPAIKTIPRVRELHTMAFQVPSVQSSETFNVEFLMERSRNPLRENNNPVAIFFGTLPAYEWYYAGVSKVVTDEGFDFLAISPPGIGETDKTVTRLDNRIIKLSSITDNMFLKWAIEDGIGAQLKDAIIVTQGNFVSRQYTYPLLMDEEVLGFVLFDTHMGQKWINAVDPIQNDHYFYRTKTTNYRYGGDAILEHDNNIELPSDLDSDELSSINVECRKNATGLRENLELWKQRDLNTLGPLNYFDGKYEIDGWREMEMILLSKSFDQKANDETGKLRSLSRFDAYFTELKDILREFLPYTITNVLNGSNNINFHFTNNGGSTFREERKNEYVEKRMTTDLKLNTSKFHCIR